MNGMACWFENRDHIIRNTFAANHREGLSVLGASGPLIERNVFWNHTQAVYQGNISDPSPNAQASEMLRLHENLFWHNPIPVVSSLATDPEPSPQPVPIPLASFPGNLEVDPGFRDPDRGDFALLGEGNAMKSGAGSFAPLPQASSWPLQPQEEAIIPTGDTRDSRQWKRPEPS